jgi:uncharacterized membrane protein YphA (DoxX/SURF4 family)
MTQHTSPNYGALITRLSLGGILLSHGLLKVLVFTIPGTVGYFASLGLPAIAAYLTIFAEIAGGTAILLGLYTRLASLLSIPALAGCALGSCRQWLGVQRGRWGLGVPRAASVYCSCCHPAGQWPIRSAQTAPD